MYAGNRKKSCNGRPQETAVIIIGLSKLLRVNEWCSLLRLKDANRWYCSNSLSILKQLFCYYNFNRIRALFSGNYGYICNYTCLSVPVKRWTLVSELLYCQNSVIFVQHSACLTTNLPRWRRRRLTHHVLRLLYDQRWP